MKERTKEVSQSEPDMGIGFLFFFSFFTQDLCEKVTRAKEEEDLKSPIHLCSLGASHTVTCRPPARLA